MHRFVLFSSLPTSAVSYQLTVILRMRSISVSSWHLPLLAGSLIVYSTITTWPSRPKSPSIMPCVSVLLFGCETWTLYRRHFKALEAYHAKSLLKILGLHWWHKVPRTEMRCRANIHSMEHLVMQCQLRWIGHVIRMQSNRLPRRILYSELQHGQRAPGGQKKCFSDHVKAILKKCLNLLITSRHWHLTE